MGNDRPVSTAAFIEELERQRREQRRRDMIDKRLLTAGQFRRQLGALGEASGMTIEAGHVFVLGGPSGEELYPAFLADPAYAPPVLESICMLLDGLTGECKWDFFTSPRESLGGMTPLEASVNGRVEDVLAAARAFSSE